MERRLYAYEYAKVPYDDAIELLADDASRVLQDATEAGTARADEVVSTLRVPLGGFEVGRDVRITVGEFEPAEVLRGVLPLSWRADRGAGLFPAVEAVLELSALSIDPPLTQVTLIGSYTPPLGALGDVGDAMMGHRVAEATVRRFVDDVTTRLEETLATSDRA